MKKIFRILAVILALGLSMSMLAACGESSEKGGNETEQSTEKAATSGDFDIKDIDWKVESGIANGKRRLSLELTNNTPFTIMVFKVYYKEKSGVTEETRNTYFDHIKELMDYDENDSFDVDCYNRMTKNGLTMWTGYEGFVRSGESIDPEVCCYFDCGYIVDDENYINYIEPDHAEIKYVKDDKIVTMNYDFVNSKATTGKKTEDAYEWTSESIAEKLPKPTAEVVHMNHDSDSRLRFNIYGWDESAFKSYVDECKNIGYTVNAKEESDEYKAENADGYKIEIEFNMEKSNVEVELNAPK